MKALVHSRSLSEGGATMATGGKLLGAMLLTALWLSAVEGVMAAGRRQIALPNQELPGELGLLPDLSAKPVAISLKQSPPSL